MVGKGVFRHTIPYQQFVKRMLYVVLAVSLSCSRASGQNAVINIGIMPFDAVDANAVSFTSAVEDQVASCFMNRSRFLLLNKTITEGIKKEIATAKSNSSIDQIFANQGRLAGAHFLIFGEVGSLTVSQTASKNYLGTVSSTYHGNMQISLRIMDVGTGQIAFAKHFDIVSTELDHYSQSDLVDNILCKFSSIFHTSVGGLFLSSITIVKIEKVKNGIPLEVLLNVGNEMFQNGRNFDCGYSGGLSGLFSNKKVFRGVYVKEPDGDDPLSTKERKIGELQVVSVEGEFTVCKVSKGAEEIKDMLYGNKKVYIKFGDGAITLKINDDLVFPDLVFPSSFKEYAITNPEKFESRLRDVLNSHCKYGFHSFEKDNRVEIRSPYAPLNLSKTYNLNGEIAYFVSYSIKEKTFRIAFKTRENKPQDTDYRNAGQTVLDACGNQIDLIAKEINR